MLKSTALIESSRKFLELRAAKDHSSGQEMKLAEGGVCCKKGGMTNAKGLSPSYRKGKYQSRSHLAQWDRYHA
jgi:hypothetical protein